MNTPNYKLRIVIYKGSWYYQFIPESIYEYIKEIPMWKFIENVLSGEILENQCYLIAKSSKREK
jgi:hypothetical protein